MVRRFVFVSKGMRDSLSLTWREMWININHVFGVLKAKRISKDVKELKLHLGCGKRHLKGWLNIDIKKDADVFLDLRERWPFEPSSVGEIYAEHLLEHFEYPGEARHFLQEANRVLKPGGEIRLGVPDTEWPLISYSKGPEADYFKMAKELWHPEYVNTPLEHINWHFRDFKGQHKYTYDEQTLRYFLSANGFVKIECVSFNPEIDSEKRKLGTFYVKAYKPKIIDFKDVQGNTSGGVRQ